eukprot:4558723-Lingulodinium_polyedra.AAC.1
MDCKRLARATSSHIYTCWRATPGRGRALGAHRNNGHLIQTTPRDALCAFSSLVLSLIHISEPTRR